MDENNLHNKLYKITDGDKSAILTVDKLMLDPGTMRQIRLLMRDPTISNPVFMPDVHAGVGSCVGLTSKLTNKVAPAIISGDIGCGITVIEINKQLFDKYSLEQFDFMIRSCVPIDEGRTIIHEKSVVEEIDLLKTFERAAEIAFLFASRYKSLFGIDISEYVPNYGSEWLQLTCKKINSDFDYDMRSLGTPRNGNHYVELNGDGNKYYLSTHCGSCNFGSKVYLYHQAKISDHNKMDWDTINEQLHNIQRKIKVPKLLKQAKDNLIENAKSKLHEPYLETTDAYKYFFDMIFAQCYASLNRLTIIKRILTVIGYDMTTFNPLNLIESVHNYIDFEDLIVRKGAIKLHASQIGIVALNMRDGFLLVESTNDNNLIEKWNLSCCHGCGRDYPRYQAKHKFTMKDYVQSMQGVYSKSIVVETLDECPGAYRSPNVIIEALNTRVTILGQYKTLLNIKGYGK